MLAALLICVLPAPCALPAAAPPERLRHAAAGYGRDGNVIEGNRHTYPEMAAAGLWTTPSDLARFFAEIARARAGKSSKIATAVATEMTKPVNGGEVSGAESVGLGVFLSERNGAPLFGHGGSDEGFQANAVASLDEGYGVIVMANSDNGSRIFAEIERAVFAEYGWPGAEPEHVRVALDPAKREQVLGHYVPGRMETAIAQKDGKLVAWTPFEPPVELVPIGPDRLIHSANGSVLEIVGAGTLEVHRPPEPKRTITRVPAAEQHPLFALESGDFDGAVATWRERVKARPAAAEREEREANALGNRLMERAPAQALEVLRLVATVFPESSNAHDSLGEVYALMGDKARAISAYEQSLKLLDGDQSVREEEKGARRSNAEEQLAKLRAAN